ncbi:MAG: Uma2 family endonuclease, partial [Vicinamibacteria bacterium]
DSKMVELKIEGFKTAELPYTLRIYGVTEKMFDEMVDEDTKAELIDGVMIVHSPASLEHEDIGSFLGGLMKFYAGARNLGLVIGSGNGVVRLAAGRRLAPDGFFIAKERVPQPLPKEFSGAPDLVVEVLSPSTRAEDLTDKRSAYRAARVGEVWFVDHENKRVVVDRLGTASYSEENFTQGKITSAVMKGFWIRAEWLWSEPLPDPLSCLNDILSTR